jgi:hypothetical protein
MKNGLSALNALCRRSHEIASSARSSERWYPSSGVLGGATTVVLRTRCGSYWGRLAGEEAVEVFESESGGPSFEEPGSGRLLGRSVVPLAERRRGVAVLLEHLGDGRAAARYLAGITVPVVGQLRDLTIADLVMVSSGQQRRPRRRAHRGRVKPVIGNPFGADSIHGVGACFTTERRRRARTRVIDQDDDDVGGAVGKPAWNDALCIR